MKNIKISMLLCFLFFNNWVIAQTFVAIKPESKSQIGSIEKLSIGDKIPNVYFKHLINYKKQSASFNTLKGKLTVLDFWSSACSACIDLFPHMEQLQNQFVNQLQIILVNGKSKLFNDDKTKITRILSTVKRRTGTTVTLPVVYNNNVLDNYFPSVKLPHEVWINEKGVVIAITGPAELNSGNVAAILNGRKINMRYKNDSNIDLGKQTINELLYGNDRIVNEPLFSSTLLKGKIDGLNGRGIRVNEKNIIYGLYVVNQPLLFIYRYAYPIINNCSDNQLLFENADPSLFKKVDFLDTASYSQLYSYDLTAPAGKLNDLLKYMQSDLDKFFHLSVTKEKRNMICYSVKAPIDSNTIRSKEKEAVWETTNANKYIQKYPVNVVLSELNRLSSVPLIDETGLKIDMDMKLPGNLYDIDAIIKTLKDSGFEVTKEIRDMDVVVFRDKH